MRRFSFSEPGFEAAFAAFIDERRETPEEVDAAVRDVKGKVEDKAALQKALEAKRFKSVRGDFKFNANHYPVQNYYLRAIGKDASGRITNKTMGTIFTNHADAYVASCKMK